MTVYEKYTTVVPGWTYPLILILCYFNLSIKRLPLTAEELLDIVMTQVGPELRDMGHKCDW